MFPANSKSGHIEEPRTGLDQAYAEAGIQIGPHDFRRTFITVAATGYGPPFVQLVPRVVRYRRANAEPPLSRADRLLHAAFRLGETASKRSPYNY